MVVMKFLITLGYYDDNREVEVESDDDLAELFMSGEIGTAELDSEFDLELRYNPEDNESEFVAAVSFVPEDDEGEDDE